MFDRTTTEGSDAPESDRPGEVDPTALSELHHDLLSRMDRRRFLRALVNVGFGAGAAQLLTPSDFLSADPGEVPVVYALERGEDPWAVEPRTKAVPVEWYNEFQRAMSIQEALVQVGVPGLAGSFVVPGDFQDPEASLAIDLLADDGLPTIEEVLGDLRYATTVIGLARPRWGVDVDVTVTPDRDVIERGRIPGGLPCEGSTYGGTLAPAMFDPTTRSRFYTTSNHLYGGGGAKETAHRGETLDLRGPVGSVELGTVDRGYPRDDVVRVDPADGVSPASWIAQASPSRVVGQFTAVGLADLHARGEPLEKVGARTGHTAGEIKGLAGVTCYYGTVCKRGQLKWGDQRTMSDGDSGSVSFHPDPERPEDGLLVAGFNNARTWWPSGDFTWGTAAHHLRGTHGFHF